MAVEQRVALDLAALEAAASAVPDPELPVVTLGDLGIVRGVAVAGDGAVEVRLTPTYVGCPATEVIASDVRIAVAARLSELGAPDVEVRTRTAMSPPWSTDWISDDGRRKLAEHGIAPPTRGARHAGGPVAVAIGQRPTSPSPATHPPFPNLAGQAAAQAAGSATSQAASQAAGSATTQAAGSATGRAAAHAAGSAAARPAGQAASQPAGSVAATPACPRCGSADTRELSAFGSTPCQSLRACRACGEPFGAVKSL